tara:strand:+ start:1254 stop:1385 length:132 start_codon:yes stop_codon:yes gene_type:complete
MLNNKNTSIICALAFGVGMSLALNSWLLGIMFGMILFVELIDE